MFSLVLKVQLKGVFCEQFAEVASSNNIKDYQLLSILFHFQFNCSTLNLPIEGTVIIPAWSILDRNCRYTYTVIADY